MAVETSRDSETTVVVSEGASTDAQPAEPAVGTSVGRYVILSAIGHGGMGRVLRAYDPKLQREVAIKEVLGAWLGREGAARLVSEARAMAKLSHPNVVAIYDVEELDQDRLALVMEFVPGTTFSQWLRESPRRWRDVVAQFVEAGRGLAAAHGAGLLHRDFKPANVLVGDGRAVKVTDFGLAKAVSTASLDESRAEGADEDATDDSVTVAGRAMGTPTYMAPEQHAGDLLTPAADQYAFCVALWQALCGDPPFRGADLAKRKRAGPPAWPGPTVPRRVAAAVRRGLSPVPEERWPSMDALLTELSIDPSARLRRWGAGVGGLVALGLAIAGTRALAPDSARCTGAKEQLAGIWDDARRAEVEAAVLGIGTAYAHPVWARTAADLDAYAEGWQREHTDACEATTVRGEQSSAAMDLRMACLQRAMTQLVATTQVLSTANADVIPKAHELIAALPPLDRCRDIEALQANVEPPPPEEAEAVAEVGALVAETKAMLGGGRYAPAEETIGRAEHMLQDIRYPAIRVEVASVRASLLESLGKYDEAEADRREALRLASTLRDWNGMREAATALMSLVGREQHRMAEGIRYREIAMGLAMGDPLAEAAVRSNLANVLEAEGKYTEAEAELRRALALRKEIEGDDHPSVATLHGNLGVVLTSLGRADEGEAELRRAIDLLQSALGPRHPKVASVINGLAVSLKERAKLGEAESEFRRALAILQEAFGPEHPDVTAARNNLAAVLEAQGRHEEAEAEHRAILALEEKTRGPDHPSVAESRNNLAIVLFTQGRYAEAETEYRQALVRLEEILGNDHPDVAFARNNLANALFEQGKYAESEAESRRALVSLEEKLGPKHPVVATLHFNLAYIIRLQGKLEQAEAESRRALELRLEALDPDDPRIALSRHWLGSLLFERGHGDEALPLVEAAWQRRQADDVDPAQRAETAFLLAQVSWTAGGDTRRNARPLAERALAELQKAGPGRDEALSEIHEWLRHHRGR